MRKDLKKALKAAPADLEIELKRVLAAMSQDEADEIIGEVTDEYKLLGGAMRAIYGLLWAGMRNFGLRQNQLSLKRMSQNMILMSVIVHYAYAMGIRRGRTDERQS